MSWGGVGGAILGGIIGYFVAPYTFGASALYGMYVGASIGYMVGTYIDPVKADKPSAGAPNSAQFYKLQFTSNTIGSPVYDVLGTAKVGGTFLAYGAERSVAITQTTKTPSGGKGGGGGSTTNVTTVGYNYYMTFAEGICVGPVDTLLAIYKDDDQLLWSGELNRPLSGGQETIAIPDYGSIVFYFGTTDQVANPTMGTIIPDATLNTGYRGLCWALFNDFNLGDYHRVPSLKFIIRKTPVLSFSGLGASQTYDYNPAHALWYILHNMVGFPESWSDTTDFGNVASTLYVENRGISMLFGDFQPASSYISSVLLHMDGVLRYGSDMKFHPKLLRQDYAVSELPLIDENVILEDPAFTRANFNTTSNELKIQYNEIANVTRGGGIQPLGGVYFTAQQYTSLFIGNINTETFTTQGSVLKYTSQGHQIWSCKALSIDPNTNTMWTTTYNSAPGVEISKWDLSKMNTLQSQTCYVTGFQLPEMRATCSVIDSENGFMYVGCCDAPDSIVKIELTTPSRVDSIVLNNTYPDYLGGPPGCAVIDTVNGFLYVGLNTVPGKIVKIRLSDFTHVDTLVLEYGLNYLTSAVIDTFGGYVYFGTSVMVPGDIIKVRLSDFAYIGHVSGSIQDWELSDFASAIIDPYRGFAYFCSGHGLGCVLRINLHTFAKAGAAPFDEDYSPYEAYPRAAVIDVYSNMGYFGCMTNPSWIVKVNLATMERVDAMHMWDGAYSGYFTEAGGGL